MKGQDLQNNEHDDDETAEKSNVHVAEDSEISPERPAIENLSRINTLRPATAEESVMVFAPSPDNTASSAAPKPRNLEEFVKPSNVLTDSPGKDQQRDEHAKSIPGDLKDKEPSRMADQIAFEDISNEFTKKVSEFEGVGKTLPHGLPGDESNVVSGRRIPDIAGHACTEEFAHRVKLGQDLRSGKYGENLIEDALEIKGKTTEEDELENLSEMENGSDIDNKSRRFTQQTGDEDSSIILMPRTSEKPDKLSDLALKPSSEQNEHAAVKDAELSALERHNQKEEDLYKMSGCIFPQESATKSTAEVPGFGDGKGKGVDANLSQFLLADESDLIYDQGILPGHSSREDPAHVVYLEHELQTGRYGFISIEDTPVIRDQTATEDNEIEFVDDLVRRSTQQVENEGLSANSTSRITNKVGNGLLSEAQSSHQQPGYIAELSSFEGSDKVGEVSGGITNFVLHEQTADQTTADDSRFEDNKRKEEANDLSQGLPGEESNLFHGSGELSGCSRSGDLARVDKLEQGLHYSKYDHNLDEDTSEKRGHFYNVLTDKSHEIKATDEYKLKSPSGESHDARGTEDTLKRPSEYRNREENVRPFESAVEIGEGLSDQTCADIVSSTTVLGSAAPDVANMHARNLVHESEVVSASKDFLRSGEIEETDRKPRNLDDSNVFTTYSGIINDTLDHSDSEEHEGKYLPVTDGLSMKNRSGLSSKAGAEENLIKPPNRSFQVQPVNKETTLHMITYSKEASNSKELNDGYGKVNVVSEIGSPEEIQKSQGGKNNEEKSFGAEKKSVIPNDEGDVDNDVSSSAKSGNVDISTCMADKLSKKKVAGEKSMRKVESSKDNNRKRSRKDLRDQMDTLHVVESISPELSKDQSSENASEPTRDAENEENKEKVKYNHNGKADRNGIEGSNIVDEFPRKSDDEIMTAESLSPGLWDLTGVSCTEEFANKFASASSESHDSGKRCKEGYANNEFSQPTDPCRDINESEFVDEMDLLNVTKSDYDKMYNDPLDEVIIEHTSENLVSNSDILRPETGEEKDKGDLTKTDVGEIKGEFVGAERSGSEFTVLGEQEDDKFTVFGEPRDMLRGVSGLPYTEELGFKFETASEPVDFASISTKENCAIDEARFEVVFGETPRSLSEAAKKLKRLAGKSSQHQVESEVVVPQDIYDEYDKLHILSKFDPLDESNLPFSVLKEKGSLSGLDNIPSTVNEKDSNKIIDGVANIGDILKGKVSEPCRDEFANKSLTQPRDMESTLDQMDSLNITDSNLLGLSKKAPSNRAVGSNNDGLNDKNGIAPPASGYENVEGEPKAEFSENVDEARRVADKDHAAESPVGSQLSAKKRFLSGQEQFIESPSDLYQRVTGLSCSEELPNIFKADSTKSPGYGDIALLNKSSEKLLSETLNVIEKEEIEKEIGKNIKPVYQSSFEGTGANGRDESGSDKGKQNKPEDGVNENFVLAGKICREEFANYSKAGFKGDNEPEYEQGNIEKGGHEFSESPLDVEFVKSTEENFPGQSALHSSSIFPEESGVRKTCELSENSEEFEAGEGIGVEPSNNNNAPNMYHQQVDDGVELPTEIEKSVNILRDMTGRIYYDEFSNKFNAVSRKITDSADRIYDYSEKLLPEVCLTNRKEENDQSESKVTKDAKNSAEAGENLALSGQIYSDEFANRPEFGEIKSSGMVEVPEKECDRQVDSGTVVTYDTTSFADAAETLKLSDHIGNELSDVKKCNIKQGVERPKGDFKVQDEADSKVSVDVKISANACESFRLSGHISSEEFANKSAVGESQSCGMIKIPEISGFSPEGNLSQSVANEKEITEKVDEKVELVGRICSEELASGKRIDGRQLPAERSEISYDIQSQADVKVADDSVSSSLQKDNYLRTPELFRAVDKIYGDGLGDISSTSVLPSSKIVRKSETEFEAGAVDNTSLVAKEGLDVTKEKSLNNDLPRTGERFRLADQICSDELASKSELDARVRTIKRDKEEVSESDYRKLGKTVRDVSKDMDLNPLAVDKDNKSIIEDGIEYENAPISFATKVSKKELEDLGLHLSTFSKVSEDLISGKGAEGGLGTGELLNKSSLSESISPPRPSIFRSFSIPDPIKCRSPEMLSGQNYAQGGDIYSSEEAYPRGFIRSSSASASRSPLPNPEDSQHESSPEDTERLSSCSQLDSSEDQPSVTSPIRYSQSVLERPRPGDLSPIIEEASPMLRRLSRPLSLVLAPTITPLRSEVNNTTLCSGMLKDLEAEVAWISAMQEGLLNDSFISLNDNENQKLLDHYYEINNDLLSHKQSCLALCAKAEQMTSEGINLLPSDLGNVLENKAHEIRSKFGKLTQETASRIRLLTTCLENLEQLTFQLQDSKVWLTTTQQQLNDTLNITDPQPENLSTVQAQIGLVERELLAKQGDFASVSLCSQKFLTSLENYSSAKTEYATNVGADISNLKESAENVISSVNTAVTWVQNKFNSLAALTREQSTIYSEAASGFNDFSAGLATCHEALDVAEKNFWQSVRKLLAAGVDVNPRSDTSARVPLNTDLITNPAFVRDQAALLFALDPDLSRIMKALENLDEQTINLTEKILPAASISASAIIASVRKPLDSEKSRLSSLTKDLHSIEGELKSLLSTLFSSEKAVEDTLAWLEGSATNGKVEKQSTLSDALHAVNKMQAELSARELGLEFSLRDAKKELQQLEESVASSEAIEMAKRKVDKTQQLVEKCADIKRKLSSSQELLSKLDRDSSLLDKALTDVKVVLESSQADFHALESGRLSKEECNKVLDEMKATKNTKEVEIAKLEDAISKLESKANELGREGDIKAAKEKLSEALGNLAVLEKSVLQAQQECDERFSRQEQFEASRARLIDWIQSLETRLNAGIFAERFTIDETSLHEQLRELDKIESECNSLGIEVAGVVALLKPSDDKLILEAEGLKNRHDKLKKHVAGIRSSASNTLERLETFNRAYAEANVWMTHRLGQISQIHLESADSQEILVLKTKVDRFKENLEAMTPRMHDLEQLGTELLIQKGTGKGSNRIRDHLTDLEKKWRALDTKGKERSSEFADTYSQALALEQCYNDLDNQLTQHSRTFENLSTVPPSKEQLQKLLSLQFGLIRIEPSIHAFEEAAGQFLNSLPASADASDLSSRVNGARSHFHGLMGVIESRLETLQDALADKTEREASKEHEITGEAQETSIEESKEILKSANVDMIESKVDTLKGNKEPSTSEGEKLPSEALSDISAPKSTKISSAEYDASATKFDSVKERVAALQAWLDLESATSDSPIFESGVYPATNSGLTKAVQRAETFLALVKSRRKQLDSLSAEAEDMMNPDVVHEINKFQTQLGDIERRHADKLKILQEIRAKTEPIETDLQAQQLVLDDLESQFQRDLGSNSCLKSLLQDVISHKFPPVGSKIQELKDALSKFGDENPDQSIQSLKQQESELRQRAKRLESSVRRANEGGKDDQEATSNLLTRGDLIKRRLDELEAQLEIARSGGTSLDPDSQERKLNDSNVIIDKLKECEDALKSLKADKKDLPPLPLLDNLMKDLKRRSIRVREATEVASEELRQKTNLAKYLSEQQEILSRSISEAHSSSPLRPRRAPPTPEELDNYREQYLVPLKNQLQAVQKAATALCEQSRPGLGKRALEQDLSATAAEVEDLFTMVDHAKEHIGGESILFNVRFNDARRLENLVQFVHDELESLGVPTPTANAANMEALLDKLTGLRNLLQTHQNGFKRLSEENMEGSDKLIADYYSISAAIGSRIGNISDALNRLKEFNILYEGYLGWLANAEPRLNNLAVDKDPAVTYANRIAELKKLSEECTQQTDNVIQLQTRGTELLGMCSTAETSIIKDKMEHVGSSFTEFFEKVNNALRGLESANDEIYAILESNAFLSDDLPKMESRLRDGESTMDIVNELIKDVKPRAEKLRKALEKIKKKVPDFLFLDLPSQRHGLSVGNLAADNISRFDDLLSETTEASRQGHVLNMQVENACIKLREDEKWLDQAMQRLDSKGQNKPTKEVLNPSEEVIPESSIYNLAVLPAQADQLGRLIGGLNAFREEYSKRQPEIEEHLKEAKRLLEKSLYRDTENDLASTLEGMVKRVIQQNKDVDGLLDSVDARSQQALALSKSLLDDLTNLEGWMSAAESVLDQIPMTPLAVEEESERLRKLHIAAKTLERELDGYKVTLDQASSTVAALSALIAPSEAADLDAKVQRVAERFRRLAKRVRNRSIDLEDAVTNSIDINDRLNILNEALDETRDLAATIGVRLDPPSHDSAPQMPSDFDHSSIPPSTRIQQPVSMRSEYLSGQIAEGRAILDTLERRLPVLKELTSVIEERLAAQSTERTSKVTRGPLSFEEDEQSPIDSSVLFKAQLLQREWLQMHTKVSQRVTNLVDAYRIASEEFWLPLSNFQSDLMALRRSMDSLVTGSSAKYPLEPSTYEMQIEGLQKISEEIKNSNKRLDDLRGVGDKIVELLIEEKARSESEKGILKNEINSSIREVNGIANNLMNTCEQQKVSAKDHLCIAQKLQHDLKSFVNVLEKAEKEFEAVANHTDDILQQIDQLEAWSGSVMPKHEQIENLNWTAGQLMSAACVPEGLLSEGVDGDRLEGKGAEVQDMLTSATSRWSDLNEALNRRRHDLQTELMSLGDFDSALDALIQWIQTVQASVDAITISRGDKKSLDFELARSKMIQANAARRQPDVVRINQEAKAKNKDKFSPKLTRLNQVWEKLKQSLMEKQEKLEEALREAQNFYSQLDELRREYRRLEGKISAPRARLIGGLPDSAKQSLNRCQQLHTAIENLGGQIGNLRSSSAGMLASAGATRDRLVGHLEGLNQQQHQLLAQSQERLMQVQSGFTRVTNFHKDLGDFIQWLTQAERRMSQAPGISYVPSTLQLQLPTQTAMRREIASKREKALTSLDRSMVFIGSHALEQDVLLVKNLLSSAHTRWEKLSQKSADRSRQFAAAYKESRKLSTAWKQLTDWLNEELNTRLQESTWCSVSTQPDVLLHELARHREFQRDLGVHSTNYDAVRRQLIKIMEKAPRDDQIELNRMLSELKFLWNAVCTKSLEKQKVLEEALLRSGQYKDAFVSLLEWINKLDSMLDESEKKGCGGDVETIKQLEEAHQNLLAQLQEREASVTKLQTTAAELLAKCRPESGGDVAELTDSLVMQEQLAGLNAQWMKVQMKAKVRSVNLKVARKNAEEFQKSCQDVFDYCAGAEYALRKIAALPEGDDPRVMDSNEPCSEEDSANSAASAVTSGMAAQETRVCDCLTRGNRILADCKNHSEAAARIRQWMNAVNTRWEEMLDWSQKHEAKLAQLSKEQRERRLTLDALISWLNTTEVILRSERMSSQPTISTGPVSIEVISELSSGSSSRFDTGSIGLEIDTTQVERMLTEVGQVSAELEERKGQRDEVLKHARKVEVVKKRPTSLKGRTPDSGSTEQSLVYASERVKEMCEKWDRVMTIIRARRAALEDRLAHANEVEKLKTFDFDAWRHRYLNWLHVKKARLIDMFYRYDTDRDGRLTRDEFTNAILESRFPTSRLELEIVAGIVDANGDGWIDLKKFNAALRSSTIPKPQYLDLSKLEGNAIEHEAKHQASLCTCHNTYRISKINGNMYRFGDSQKLRLVRILRSNVMVRVGGGWTPLTEFLVKNDPCRASFWAANESERRDAGYPEDQTHMMLKFHPRFRDGSSGSVSCTDPGCSGRPSSIPKSLSKLSYPRHLSTSSTLSRSQITRKDSRNTPVRSSLPARASNIQRKSNSSRLSSPSSSCHSLPLAKPPILVDHQDSHPTELRTEDASPPTSLNSSISEFPSERQGPPATSDPNPGANVNNQPQSNSGPLSSILEGDELKALPSIHSEETVESIRSNTQTYPTEDKDRENQ
ncbi:unnamed protein product [Hymenolepis diminuta]|uniref:Uncharacterized protein n=2 Tax=Hymenolepis diminuta TaxID=6216 RepID=A0A564YS95_HYMDI|nr:unnamed protein product [Hymenolepis diminuta]